MVMGNGRVTRDSESRVVGRKERFVPVERPELTQSTVELAKVGIEKGYFLPWRALRPVLDMKRVSRKHAEPAKGRK